MGEPIITPGKVTFQLYNVIIAGVSLDLYIDMRRAMLTDEARTAANAQSLTLAQMHADVNFSNLLSVVRRKLTL